MSRGGMAERCGVIDDVDGFNKYIDMPIQFIKTIKHAAISQTLETNTLVTMLLSQQ